MATAQDTLDSDAGDDLIQGPPRQEHRWPASVAVLATLVMYVSLPEQLTAGPSWVVPLLVAALLVPLSVAAPMRHGDEAKWHRVSAIALIALINAANVVSLVLLVYSLLHGSKAEGGALIVEAFKIWLTNVIVYGLWYWELDRGGPGARLREERRPPDFLFPQMQMAASGRHSPHWRPVFLDYLYVAFTNATAFSPTDTLPLSPWAKMLMALQAMASLLTVALVAARAVNILS